MPTVQLPDGTTALFPDSMALADIQNAITAHLGGQPAPAAAPQPPGAIQSLLQSLGIPTNRADAKAAADMQNPLKHPLRALAGPALPVAESIAAYGKRVFSNAYDAGQSLAAGNPSQAGLDAINSIPVVGPAVEKMADNATIDPKASYLQQVRQGVNRGNVGTAVGTALQIAPALLGAVDTAAPGRALVAPIKPAIQAAAVGNTDAAVLRGLQVGAKSPKALATINAADNAKPFLQGAQDMADLQSRIAPAKAAIWQPYQQAIDAIGDRPVQGPDGMTTVGDLENERLQLSALNRGVKTGDPAALQLAQQKGMTAAQLLDRENAVKAALDPQLESTGINPQLIRKVFGSVSQVGARVAGKTTLIEAPQPSGIGKIANISIKQPLQAPTQIASGLRDLLAGRPAFSVKPTDLGIREGFANAGPAPDFGTVRTTGVEPPARYLLNAPPTQLEAPATPYQPPQPPNFYYDTSPMRTGRLLNAPPTQLGGSVQNAPVSFRYDTTPMRQGRLLEAPTPQTPLSSHVDIFPNQRPGATTITPRLADIIKKAKSQ